MKKVLFTAIVLMLVAAFGISAFMVGSYLIDGKKQEERNDELSEIVANVQTGTTEASEVTETTEVPETTEETTVPTETTEPTEPGILPGYKEIYEMLLHMFLLNLLNIFVCVVSLSYQSKVIAEQSLLPGGKWVRPVVVVVMHGVSFFAAHLMFPGGLF